MQSIGWPTDIPKDPNPIISGKKSLYTLNDIVNLTCTSSLSLPEAHLTATVNGTDIVADHRFQHRIYHQKYENNLMTTSINIQFNTKYLTHRVPFECQSTQYHKHNRSAQILLATSHKNPQQIINSDDNIFYIEGKSNEMLSTVAFRDSSLGSDSSYGKGFCAQSLCLAFN